jgi:hypothetical protein
VPLASLRAINNVWIVAPAPGGAGAVALGTAPLGIVQSSAAATMRP